MIDAAAMSSLVTRIETVNGEIYALNQDKRDLYREARARGFCAKTLKRLIKLRRLDPETRQCEQVQRQLYLAALEEGS